jgi:PAS domain S-box-containing protein
MPSKPPKEPTHGAHQKKKIQLNILMVEDDTDDALLIKQMLLSSKLYELQLSVVQDKEKALTLLDHTPFQVCLIDYRLGAHNGLEILRLITRKHLKTACILLTGQENEELGIRALRSGAEDYLAKSELNPSMLVRSIRYAIERTAAKQRLSTLLHKEALLRESARVDQEISYIIESFSDPFIVLNRNLEYLYINSRSEEYFDTPKSELIGQQLFAIFPYLKNSPLDFTIQRAIQTQKPQTMDFYSRMAKRWFQATMYPYPDKIAVHFSDIHERKAAEERKDEFISIAGHELRTPLTSIKAYLQFLQLKFTQENFTAYLLPLQKVTAQVNRLNNLVSDLLDVTKIQQGKLQYNDSPCKLDAIISSIAEDMQTTCPTHKINITQNEPLTVFVDENRLNQVLINLISNAIKYSPNSREITIVSEEKNSEARVSVTDFGAGIAKKYHKLIFDRFYRVSSSDAAQQGMGIGLYISSQIINHYGGSIKLDSTLGKGSTFSFTLPIQRDQKANGLVAQ